MNTIQDFLLGLDYKQQAIVSLLHQRLTDHHGLVQHIKYEIPMYYQKTWVCYLNTIKKQGIELAFLKGNELSNEQNLLDRKGRKMVAGIDFYHASEIPIILVDQIVQEALILDRLSKSK